jgi:hypothetical protein
MVDLARAVTAPMGKAVRGLEKAVMSRRCDGDGGKRAAVFGRGGDAAWWALGHRGQRRGNAAERGCSTAVESFLENRYIRLWL